MPEEEKTNGYIKYTKNIGENMLKMTKIEVLYFEIERKTSENVKNPRIFFIENIHYLQKI